MSSRNVVDLRGIRRHSAPVTRRAASRISRTPASARSARRGSPLRVRRRKLRALAVAIVALMLVGVAYGVSWVSYLPQYSISSVAVSGAQHIRAVRIKEFVDTKLYTGVYSFLSSRNVFLYDKARIEQAIVAFFPRVKSAKISRASLLANAITVTIEERAPYAKWCTGESDCYEMDQSGFVFGHATTTLASTTATQYVFRGGLIGASTTSETSSPIGKTFVPSHMPGILALLQLLSQSDFIPQGATIENEEDFSVSLADGFVVKASFGEDANALVKNLNLILSSGPLENKRDQIEYIDLRFGDKIYYKLKGATAVKA